VEKTAHHHIDLERTSFFLTPLRSLRIVNVL
jgi:hypothetical protein